MPAHKAYRAALIPIGLVLLAELTTRLSQRDQPRFQQLPASIQDMFRSGDLNPALLLYILSWPDYFLTAMDVSGPRAQRAIAEMCRHFKTIHDIARSSNARAIIVSVPCRARVCSADLQNIALFGVPVPASIADGNLDAPIQEAAECSGIAFHHVTPSFHERCPREALYYRFDGHLNHAGNRLFAESMIPIVEAVLQSRSGQ
jgi:hypothetical protein